MSATVTRFVRDESGTTLIEFALVVPVLILVLVVCLDFARAMNANVTLTSAAREGAHFAITHPTADDDTIKAYIAGRVVPLDPNALVITLTPITPASNPRCATPCWSSSAPSPRSVEVVIRYPWNAVSAIAAGFLTVTSGPTWFEASSQMEAVR